MKIKSDTKLFDKDGAEIFIGDDVLMPEPNGKGDAWKFGGFAGTIIDYIEETGLLIVEDADSDCFSIEPNRVRGLEE